MRDNINTHHSNASVEIVRWVAESLRPFSIVDDRAFQSLMKTGRPEYWIPSRWTVASDVHKVFDRTRARIAKLLQVSTRLAVKARKLS